MQLESLGENGACVFAGEVIHTRVAGRVLIHAEVFCVAAHNSTGFKDSIEFFQQECVLLEKLLVILVVTHVVDIVRVGE